MTRKYKCEQADAPHGRHSGYRKFLKKSKNKAERRQVKDQIKHEEDPVDSYGKYYGWEW